MDVVVPFSPSHPKTRLSPALSARERREFAHVLLSDVLDALAGTRGVADGDVTVLSTAPLDEDVAVRVQLDDRSLTPAVNAILAAGVTGPAPSNLGPATGADEGDPDSDDDRPGDTSADSDDDHPGDTGADSDGVAVVMADLALATPTALERFFEADGDVVLAPGRGVGTNALVSRHLEFRVDFHGPSYLDHRANADAVDADVTVVDSHRLATDVDEPADLAEVLAHGTGAAPDWLRDRGFELVTADGRVRASRHES